MMNLSQGLNRYAANTLWLFAQNGIRMILSLVVGAFVIRSLGPDKFGLLSYAISFVGMFATLGSLGLDGIVTRELVNNDSKRDLFLGSTFGLRLVGMIIMFAMLIVAIQFTSNDSYINLLIFIIAGKYLFDSLHVIDFFFQSKVLSKFVVKARVFASLSFYLFQVFLVLINASLAWFSVAFVLNSFLFSLVLLLQYLKFKLSPLKWRFNFNIACSLLSNSWPMIFRGVLISIYMKIDQIMLREMLGNEAVGNYAAAVRISEASYFIPVVICGSLFPAIINSRAKNKKLYFDRLQHLYDILLVISITIAISVFFMADSIVYFLYGNQYLYCSDVLSIHIWACIIVFWGVARSKWILAENLQHKALLFDCTGALLNIILNYYLIPNFGPTGAAWATLISYFVTSYFVSLIVSDFRVSWIMFNKSFVNLLRFKFINLGSVR